MTIDHLRARIDELDERLVDLLNQRMMCALEIGRLKHEAGLEIYQPEREKEVVRHVQECGQRAQGPLGRDALARVFERIIDEARRLERAAAQKRDA
jgi:chorismate mutase-like protein